MRPVAISYSWPSDLDLMAARPASASPNGTATGTGGRSIPPAVATYRSTGAPEAPVVPAPAEPGPVPSASNGSDWRAGHPVGSGGADRPTRTRAPTGGGAGEERAAGGVGVDPLPVGSGGGGGRVSPPGDRPG